MQIARMLTAQVDPAGNSILRIPQAQAIAQQTSRAMHLQDERKANEDE